MKPTPGPWTFRAPDTDGAQPPMVIRAREGGFVVMGLSREREIADARLIAAAPDLLEACEQALAFAHGYEDVRDGADGKQLPNAAMSLCITLRDALAKARGGK